MKKIIYFVFAALALVACEPNNGATEKVRIGVSLEDNDQPQNGPQRISAVDRGTMVIDVNWEEGDKLYWRYSSDEVLTANNPFHIVSGIGTKNAFFECDKLIGETKSLTLYYYGSESFNANIDAQVTHIDTIMNGNVLTNEHKTIIKRDYLKYIAKNCKIGNGIKLEPQFGVLGVEVFGDNLENLLDYACKVSDKSCTIEDKGTTAESQYSTTVIGSLMYYFVFWKDEDGNIKIPAGDLQLVQGGTILTYNVASEITLTPGKASILQLDYDGMNLTKHEQQ